MEELLSVAKVLPAGPPLREDQQIGRSGARDSLHERLLGGSVVLLMEPRRVGKTSLAQAVLARIRRGGGLTGELQLSSYADPQLAAAELARQLVAGLDRIAEPSRRLLDRFRLLGASGAGRDTSMLADFATVLLGKPRDLPTLLQHCGEHLPSGRHGAVLLDEAHVVADWPTPLKDALSTQLRANARLGIVIASSETRAFEQLFGAGGALQFAGARFKLPPIAAEDWRLGLQERFARLGLEATPELLGRLLEAAGGHPYRTMWLAQETARAARSMPTITKQIPIGDGDLDAALLAVRADPAWKELG